MAMRHVLTSSVVVSFVLLTIHLILQEPASSSARTQDVVNNAKFRVFEGDNQTAEHKRSNYVIFDAFHYAGGLQFLNNVPAGWRVIVVNLNNSNALTSCSSCLQIRRSWVKNNVVDRLPDGVMGLLSEPVLSKMAAFVYVQSRKTPWIYVTDVPGLLPFHKLTKLAKHEVRAGIVFQGPGDVFEPCGHFVDTFTWRGKGLLKKQNRYNVKVISTHSVHQLVGNCYRGVRDATMRRDALDLRAPKPYLMPGTFAAMDFNNVLVPGETAWAMVASLTRPTLGVPVKSKDQAFDTSRLNMLVQRILWETEAQVGFIPISPYRRHCPSCLMNETIQSLGSKYREQLTAWRCDSFETVTACLDRLAGYEARKRRLNKKTRQLVSVWVQLLNCNKVVVAKRVPVTAQKLQEKNVGIPVYFTPAKSMHRKPANATLPPNVFESFCDNTAQKDVPVIPKRHPIRDILLVIIFNFPKLVAHIPALEFAYGRHFRHVIYCGESMADFETTYQTRGNTNPVSFMEIPHREGYWGQNCMSAAVKMGYDVVGYLQISDDVLLNVWNLKETPRDQPWFQSNIRVANVDRSEVPDIWVNKYWWPWEQFSGRLAAVRAYEGLQMMKADRKHGERVSHFMDNLYNITGCGRCFLYEASDIFYLPAHLGANFTFFSDMFSNHQVFLEITIPTILAGLTSDRLVYRLRGNYLWFQDRERYMYVYTEHDHFYHAWKLSTFADPLKVAFYCTEFLKNINQDLLIT